MVLRTSKMDMTETELHVTLRNLTLRKKSGELDTPERFNYQDEMWRNVIDYEILWKCIKHCSLEIRRDTMELLVVSKKSTQRFTAVEYQMIETFLSYNLGEKIELAPLIKKAIKRTRDSLVVLRREVLRTVKGQNSENSSKCRPNQHEDIENMACHNATRIDIECFIQDCESFLCSLRKICVDNLYPTANYERRRTCLQILCHMQDILDEEILCLEWDTVQAKSLFNCLLLDTYESNKEMVYKILQLVPPRFLELDNKDTVDEIIRTAVGLGNSIRPIDSATAAYMFKICTASPVIVEIVNRHNEYLNPDCASNTDAHLLLVKFLISRLEKPLEIARDNIVRAANKHSLYGYLYCLRSLITDSDLHRKFPTDERWREPIAQLINICLDLNNAVGQIVNNSSPEGHLPMDLNPFNVQPSLFDQELSEHEKVTTPQMVLLCAWRTVKEVSLIFGYVTFKLPIDGMNGVVGLLTENQVVQVGEHFVTLLSETKHRGAFEQAHVGFGLLCRRLWHLPIECALKQLPKIWLLDLLLAVTGLSPRDSKLCATRRSAGVPFMVQALLTSEEESLTAVIRHGGSFTFHSTMRILLGLTNLKDDYNIEAEMSSLIYDDTVFTQFKDQSSPLSHTEKRTSNTNRGKKCYKLAEIKSHVINILRALFRHCQLGDCVKPYIADGVITAIKSYNGKTWAERNAATLLFSAMVVRIFGVQRTKDHLNLSVHNRMTGKVFFEKYPTLLEFMYNELEKFVEPGDTLIRPGVQSVLLLLSRLYPGCHDSADSNWKVAAFINMVSKCAKSQVYETRELAARALVPLLTQTTALAVFSKLLEKISMESQNYSNINMIHGYILQVLQISKSAEFSSFIVSSAQFKIFIKKSVWILEKLECRERGAGVSFPLATAYLETLLQIYQANDQWFSECVEDEDGDLFFRIKLHLIHSNILSNGPGREIYEITAAKFYTLWCPVHHDCPDSYRLSYSEIPKNNWTSLLNHNNMDVQIISWIKSTELVKSAVHTSFSESQLQDVICEANRAVEQLITDPNLEKAVFDFLFIILSNTSNDTLFKAKPSAFSNLLKKVMVYLSKRLDNQDYYVTNSFLKLLGAIYGEVSKQFQDILTIDDKKAIHKLFLKNSWMDSCDNDCRLAVSQTMYNLYEPVVKDNDNFVMCWWTMLLNLLVDDDKVVRYHAAAVLCKVNNEREIICDTGMRHKFFESFSNVVAKLRPDIAIVLLFSWGVATWREDGYQMDDTDVFNKCRNYDTFEQLEISTLCLISLKEVGNHHSLNTTLPLTTIRWLKKLYDCKFTFATLSEFVKIQYKYIPTLGNKLGDYLDPTYSDKLQQVLAFKKFTDFVTQETNDGILL
ncbi:thyroid adenoma-associated protein homolog isoform X3 [Neodiprion lecontei]|uniref:tRNA (32-2'-O)-methyltransferase regulator THADA n=2 Tax=Neodiprion lecontei TaxID=441921 RepID=A0ABM3GHR6_NEOLC|nr:thyroid adenoma-associated protein homolog isoform X3 [Neodiprion lecontei]